MKSQGKWHGIGIARGESKEALQQPPSKGGKGITLYETDTRVFVFAACGTK